MSRLLQATTKRLISHQISLDSFKTHCRQDYKWITKQGLLPSRVTGVFNGIASGPFLGYIVKCGSTYVGVSTSRSNRYTRLSHKTARGVLDWMLTGKEC